MSTQAQIEANRRNAQRSTGPTTADGKAQSSRNAIKHGFFARDLLLPGEDAQELRELKISLLRRMNPRDALELSLVDQAVTDLWKLRRMRTAEKELIEQAERASRPPGETTPTPAGIVLARMHGTEQEMELMRIHRYEQRLGNSAFRAFRELRRLALEELNDEPCEFASQQLTLIEADPPPPAGDPPQEVDNPPAIGSDSSADVENTETKPIANDDDRPAGPGEPDDRGGASTIVQNEPNLELVGSAKAAPDAPRDGEFDPLRR